MSAAMFPSNVTVVCNMRAAPISWCGDAPFWRYLRLNVVWQRSQVAWKSSEATRTLTGLGLQAHSHNRIREPEPLPRELPPRVPMPAEHGRGLVGSMGMAKVRN